MNRLNFSHMVNKNLKSQKAAVAKTNQTVKKNQSDPQGMMFFKPNERLSDEFYEKKYRGAYRRENKELSYKMDNIVAYVYSQLAEQQTSPNRLKKSRLTKQATGNKSKYSQKTKTSEQTSLLDKPLTDNKEESIFGTDDVPNLTMSQIEIQSNYLSRQKNNFKVRSSVMESNNYDNYNKMEKAMARQKELEGLVAQHKQLRDHRQSLAQDIFGMRHSLDHVKHRLDNSLKMLENKKTYSECERLEKSLKCQKCVEKETEIISPIQSSEKQSIKEFDLEFI